MPAIDFNKLQDAIPSLRPEFKWSNNVNAASKVGSIVSVIIPFIYVIAGLILLFNLIFAGFKMMTGAADEKGVAEARAKVTNSLTGFIILFLSYWIVQIVEFVLGVQIF